MASDQSAAAGSQPTALVVGNAFVQQFYHILHASPELVYQFYQESSKLSRPDLNGVMESVSTMEAINEKILAMDYSELKAEIKTVDSQESLEGGVIVLVTGYLTGKDLVKKNFMQSFFLAPQDKGFYVLNDIFRYVDEEYQQSEKVDLPNGNVESVAFEQDSPPPQEEIEQELIPPPSLEEEEEENVEEVYNPPQEEVDSAIIEEEVPVKAVIDEIPPVSQVAVAEVRSVTTVNEEAPKKTYATIVQLMKANPAPLSAPPPAPLRSAPPPARSAPAAGRSAPAAGRSAPAAARSAPAAARSAPTPAIVLGSTQGPDITADGSNIDDNNNAQDVEADGYSIYVKSLPLSATSVQLEEEFKKFGPIKPDGIQVRSHKIQGFCFGFVEFEVASAVQSAIEASPVMIGGRPAIVEEKRTTNSRANNRGGGRFGTGRGGPNFRNDGNRGRGRGGYGRGDNNFGNRGGGRGSSFNRSGSFNRNGDAGPTSGNSSPKSANPKVTAP